MNGQHYQTVALEEEWLYEIAERKRLDYLDEIEAKYPQLKTWSVENERTAEDQRK